MFYYNSGRVGELITYWLYLHPDETTLASQYYKELQNMEIGTLIYLCDVVVTTSVPAIYKLVEESQRVW